MLPVLNRCGNSEGINNLRGNKRREPETVHRRGHGRIDSQFVVARNEQHRVARGWAGLGIVARSTWRVERRAGGRFLDSRLFGL